MLHKSSFREMLLWLLRRRRRFRVTGDSMRPLLAPGDEVLIDPLAYRHGLPHVGDIVVAQHPYIRDLRLIKRVTAVNAGGRCRLEGENSAASTDSRAFGALSPAHLLGRVTSRLP